MRDGTTGDDIAAAAGIAPLIGDCTAAAPEVDSAWSTSLIYDDPSTALNDGHALQAVFDLVLQSTTAGMNSTERAATVAAAQQRLVVAGDGPLVNEYSAGHLIWANAFPTSCLFGVCGFDSKMTLTADWKTYLMLFADHRFSSDPRALFLAFNQSMRQATSRAVHAAVYSDVGAASLAPLNDLMVADPAKFQDDLEDAIREPKKHGAFVKLITNVVRGVGAKIPYTDAARKSCMSEIYALRRYHGFHSWFVTISCGDASSPLSLRIASMPENPGAVPFACQYRVRRSRATTVPTYCYATAGTATQPP
jgi:hypothetical protein